MTDTLIEYFEHQLKFEQQYGPKTVVLAQYGTFYDAFQYNPNLCSHDNLKIDKYKKLWEFPIGCACDIYELIDCDLTQKNNNKPYGIKNPSMVGFPSVSYDKNLKILLANDYVVIKLDQKEGEKNDKNKILRYVSDIISPTMSFNTLSTTVTSANIVSVYIEYMKSKFDHQCDDYVVACGVGLLDLVTGHNFITEFYSKPNDNSFCLQELYRFLTFYHPKEIVINLNDLPEHLSSDVKINPYVKFLEGHLELKRYDRYVFMINKVNPEFKKLNYQTEFFNKLFGEQMQKNNKILQELDLSKYNYGRLAYILLIQHCKKGNGPTQNIKAPLINQFTAEKKLVLTHNAAICLEVISASKKKNEINSLFSIMNQTTTNLGHRCLEYLLLNPMSEDEEIEKYYTMVEEFSNSYHDEQLWMTIEKQLMGLPDISRLHRKIELKVISPKEIAILLRSYDKIMTLLKYLNELPIPTIQNTINTLLNFEEFQKYVNHFTNKFTDSLELCYYDSLNCGKKSLEFQSNPTKCFEEQFKQLENYKTSLDAIVTHLNSFLTKGVVKISTKNVNKKNKVIKGQVKYDAKITLLLTTTTNATKLCHCPVNKELCGTIEQSAYTAIDKIITSPVIEKLLHEKDALEKQIGVKLAEYVDETIFEWLKYVKLFSQLCHVIGMIDVLHCYAKISFKNKYDKPQIVKSTQSFMSITNLRHPIVEKLIDTKYITNDVSLGKNMDNHETSPYGILLFGINGGGKSVTLKSVGLVLIMAQCGCYVPGNLTYYPYKRIITRLSTQDNIFKSESLFEVEMKELRTILINGDEYTLALADELASSTESISATCITASTILTLLNKKVSFLFTTHNHELASLKYITDLPNNVLSIKHLSISYDEESGSLIYERKLKPNAGSSYYGIMVTKYLKLPNEFTEKAEEISLYLHHEHEDYLSTKKSRHNSLVYMDHCQLCGTTENLITHHIEEQHLAKDGFIDHMPKNLKGNLFVLCNDCHMKKIHSQNKQLETLQTINGYIVKFKS